MGSNPAWLQVLGSGTEPNLPECWQQPHSVSPSRPKREAVNKPINHRQPGSAENHKFQPLLQKNGWELAIHHPSRQRQCSSMLRRLVKRVEFGILSRKKTKACSRPWERRCSQFFSLLALKGCRICFASLFFKNLNTIP